MMLMRFFGSKFDAELRHISVAEKSILDLKNRTATGRFGPVPVRFGFLFFFWFGCFLEVKTEPNRK
jgi:hypothetical protein